MKLVRHCHIFVLTTISILIYAVLILRNPSPVVTVVANTAYINQYSIKTDFDLGVSDFGAIPIKFSFAKAEGHVAYKT